MSMFERPSEDSQLFSAPESRKRSWHSWPKVMSAFAAGVACTFLIVTFSRESAPPLEQLAKSAKVSQRAEPSKPEEPKAPPPAPEAATAQSGTPGPAQAAQSPVPFGDAQRSTTATNSASPAEAGNDAAARSAASDCDRQAWPHRSRNCIGRSAGSGETTGTAASNEAQRAIRVIPTDRGAPATASSARPPAEPARNAAANRSTSEPKIPQAQQTTDGSAPAREASPERAATPEQQAPGRDTGTTSNQAPDAAPKPKAVTRSEPTPSREQAKPSSGTDTAANPEETTSERQSASSEQRAREARQAQRDAKARERQARRNAERSDRRRTVRSEEADDGETRATAFGDDSRRVRDDTRGPFRDIDEARRPTREAPVRGTRNRTEPDDDDGEVVVRSQRSRDGRQRAVSEEPRRGERQVETRTVIREEAPRPRIPFLSDIFGGGN